MTDLANILIDSSVQCWGCAVFDRLFQIVSTMAAAIYHKMAIICMILFIILLAFYILNVVWKNIRENNAQDTWYKDSLQRVFINAIVAFALLSTGVIFPRFLTTITFEPAAQIALIYTDSMLQTDPATVNERVTYQPEKISQDGFFRPQLRDTIITLMKSSVTMFQSFIKLGIAIMDQAFSWSAMLSIGMFIKHIIIFFIGLFISYKFFELFLRYCFYFVDIIIAMAYFSFFFPLSLSMVAFNGAKDVPSWMAGIGKEFGTGYFKRVINAIVGLVAAVISYTIIMVIIAKFFTVQGVSASDLMSKILSGDIFNAQLSENNLAILGIFSTIVLVYVLDFISKKIPSIQKMILDVFKVSADTKMNENMATDMFRLPDNVKNFGQKINDIIKKIKP
ncbi:MAG: hypothetical protein MJ187_01105 [Alphaproteobacteria bacterium]|nr:hypothetical protein [Alphaproteobacteria bacterium]